MNRLHSPEWHPLDFFRSLRDLGRDALRAAQVALDDARDCFEDDPEDQEIKSDRWAG